MFPLTCACVRVHTSRETYAHKKTWSAHKHSFQKCFCTYFIRGILISPGKMLHKRHFMRT